MLPRLSRRQMFQGMLLCCSGETKSELETNRWQSAETRRRTEHNSPYMENA